MKFSSRLGNLLALALLFLGICEVARGEENDPGSEGIETYRGFTEDLAAGQRLVVGVEFRPSIQHRVNRWYSQNTFQLGYRVRPDISIDYTQYWQANIADPSNSSGGFGLQGLDGFVRGKFNDLWVNAAKDTVLSLESRVYLPTDPTLTAMGYVTSIRNYAILTKTVSERFSFTVEEIPIFHFYSQPGAYVASGPAANPVFENRIYIIPSWNITRALNFSFPILLNIIRNRAFDPIATNNDKWTFVFWTWPEITYAFESKTTIGLAFLSENLIQPDFSTFNFFGSSGGVSIGSSQFILRQSF